MLYIESLQEGTLLWVGVLSMFRDLQVEPASLVEGVTLRQCGP
jgi:hypothetical protein